MPPKIKTSREMIIEAGYKIADEFGINSVNCRTIAAEIGCSTQPVFSRFPNMDELKEAVFHCACDKLEAAIAESAVCAEQNKKSLLEIAIVQLVELAKYHKNLYQLIYLSDFSKERAFLDERKKYDTNRKILDELLKTYHLSPKRAEEIFQMLSLLAHGICTVIATTSMDFSTEQAMHIITSARMDAVERKESY